jgi:hypothetical protein
MRIATIFALTVLTGFGIASLASAQVSAARDAAIHKCVNEAQARFPNASDRDTMRARTDVYMSCMRAAGQDP